MKKRVAKFLALFVMLVVFGIIEDVLAAHVSGATLIMEALPIIVLFAIVFTLITEMIEEHFETGEGPLEEIVDKIIGKKKVKKKK